MTRLFVTVRGHRDEWTFEFLGDPRNIPQWRSDGLRVCACSTVPAWIASLGLARLWTWFFHEEP